MHSISSPREILQISPFDLEITYTEYIHARSFAIIKARNLIPIFILSLNFPTKLFVAIIFSYKIFREDIY